MGTGNTDVNGKSICGNITITTRVASVTATKGTNALNCIGKGNEGNYKICGTVKFGDQTMFDGSSWTPDPVVAGTYGGLSLAITNTTNPDDTWVLQPA